MILDTSVLIAILRAEAEAERFHVEIERAETVRLSSGSLLEASIVADGPRSEVASEALDRLLEAAGVVVEPFTTRQAMIARHAYRRYGRGSGHRARLNFGDCFAYALAKELDEPLLFKGDDFRHTDVKIAG